MRTVHVEPLLRRLTRPLVSGPRRLAAFDINNYQIKLALMARRRGAPVLEAFHVEGLDEYENAGTPGLDEGQRQALREIVDEYELAGTEAVSSLPYGSYTMRLVVLPRMPRRDVREAIRLDLRRGGKFNEARELFEYVTVDAFRQDDGVYENHLVVTVDRERLHELYVYLSSLGLRVRGYTVPALSLRTLLAHDPDVDDDGVYAVVNMSHEETSFSLVHRGRLLFTREIPRTGRELTEALENVVLADGRTIHLGERRATEIKYEYGVIGEDEYDEETDEGIPLERLAMMMRPVLEKMIVEIRRSIDYCQEQFGVASPARLFLSGGGAQLRNLAPYLASRLRTDVAFMNAITGYALGENVMVEALRLRGLSMTTAIGAALRVDDDDAHLFAPRDYVDADWRWLRASMRTVAAASVVLAALNTGLSVTAERRVRAHVAQKRAALARLDEIQSRYAGQADAVKLRRWRRNALLSLIGRETPWSALMRDVSHRVGMDVLLTELRSERVTVDADAGVYETRMRFRALLSLEHDRLEDVLSRLLDGVGSSPFFDDVRLENVTADDEKRLARAAFSARLVE